MSHNDNTPDQSGSGAGGSSSSGRPDVPEYGQRVEGAPSGPSYEPPHYGQGAPGGQYSTPQYGQGQQGYRSQYGQDSDDQGRYTPGQYGQGQQSYQSQYDQGQYDQGQYGQDPYNQGQYGGQGQQGYQGYQGQYDMGGYGGTQNPAGKGLGVASLVLGILALLASWMLGLGLIPGIVGLVLGIVAVRKLGRTPGASKALAVVGIVLCALGILASVMFFFVEIAFFGEFFSVCGQYANDDAALEQCISEQMGLGTIPQ